MPEGARAPGRATRKPSQWVPCLFVISGGDLPFQPLAHENPTARPWLLYSTYSREARPELDERRRCRWYPGFCVGFDVAVAARLVLEKQGTPGLRRSARLRREPALRARERRRRREALLRFDAGVGVLYATGFLLFPGRTLALFFAYDVDDALRPFLHLAVRMVAINHYGYVAGLLAAPPERAIKVATGFLVLGGAVVVFAGQLWLDTAAAYWSCTLLTTAMIGAHVIVL